MEPPVLISLDEALAVLRDASAPLEVVRVPLDQASGLVLAADVIAAIDAPSSDVSTMDGYATSGPAGPQGYRLVGSSFPGQPFGGTVGAGAAIRITTGARVAAGCDRVLIQEEARSDGTFVAPAPEVSAGPFIRRRGSDFATGDRILDAGLRLGPGALVAAAGADRAELTVWRRPRVSILSTGDELRPPGQGGAQPDAIPESLGAGLSALVTLGGGAVEGRRIVPDDPARLRAEARRAVDSSDLVIVTGGASVGERDYSRRMFEPLGLELLFSKVAIKPGKPVWLGRVDGRLVLGLPGNPTSAMVTARLFLLPLLDRLSGGQGALRWEKARVADPMPAVDRRETLLRGVTRAGGVQLVDNQDSGGQRALGDAQWLIRRPPGAAAAPAGALHPVLALF